MSVGPGLSGAGSGYECRRAEGRVAGGRTRRDSGRAGHGPRPGLPRPARVIAGRGDRRRGRRRGRRDAPGAARGRAAERAVARVVRTRGRARGAGHVPATAERRRRRRECARGLGGAGRAHRAGAALGLAPGGRTGSLHPLARRGLGGDHHPPRPAGRTPALGGRVSPKQYYMACLDLHGRPVLVVGGGTVALEKVLGLLECGARVTVVAPEALPELLELPVEWLPRAYH